MERTNDVLVSKIAGMLLGIKVTFFRYLKLR